MSLLERLGTFAACTPPSALPAAVGASVHRRLLDTVGLCLAASREVDAPLRALAREWGGPPESFAVGPWERVPARSAAFLHGVLAHCLDFDDTHLPSVLHPSATVLPTALAVAEAQGASVSQLVAAAAVGYEVCVRLGMAGWNPDTGASVFFERGWHATSICGALGAAATAARLMGLDAAGVGHAIGIATSLGSGLLEANRMGGTVKRLHCGWAAQAGVAAAQFARAGFTAPPTALEGHFGFLRAFLGDAAAGRHLTEGLGEAWCVPDIVFKPYPCNHFTHAAVDGALALRARVPPSAIEAVELRVPGPVLRTIAEPREAKLRPASGHQAMFSGPFVVATALRGGSGLGVGLEDFTDEKARDPLTLELARKVECMADARCDALFPRHLPALLRVRTGDGQWHEAQVLHNRGGPLAPLSDDELLLKFRGNASRVLDADAVEALATALLDERERPASALLAPLAQAAPGVRGAASTS